MKIISVPRKSGKNFRSKTWGSFTILYLKTDVLLLADVMECFRKLCEKHYELGSRAFLHHPRVGLGCDAENDQKWSWSCWGMLISC